VVQFIVARISTVSLTQLILWHSSVLVSRQRLAELSFPPKRSIDSHVQLPSRATLIASALSSRPLHVSSLRFPTNTFPSLFLFMTAISLLLNPLTA
jgi:hypothetical protein